jgi:hypothetical protein
MIGITEIRSGELTVMILLTRGNLTQGEIGLLGSGINQAKDNCDRLYLLTIAENPSITSLPAASSALKLRVGAISYLFAHTPDSLSGFFTKIIMSQLAGVPTYTDKTSEAVINRFCAFATHFGIDLDHVRLTYAGIANGSLQPERSILLP